MFRTFRLAVVSVVVLAAAAGCKKEEAKAPAAAVKADDKAAEPAAKADDKAAAKADDKAAPAPAPAPPAPALVLSADAAKALEAKIAGGKADELAAAGNDIYTYLAAAKEKADGSGYEDEQAVVKMFWGFVNAQKAAVAAAADEPAKRKLMADYAAPMAKALAGAKTHILVDTVAGTPGCAFLAATPAAADAVADALGSAPKDVHSALIGCLFQSGPQTMTSYFQLTDDSKVRSERLGKALAATKDLENFKAFIGRLPMFESDKGVDAVGDALIARFTSADKDLDVTIGQMLVAKCNTKQLADFATKVAGLTGPIKDELTVIAGQLTADAATKCK